MSTANPTDRHRSAFDADGRFLPQSEEEIRRRAEEVARGLDALDEMGDEEEQRQTLDALMAAINEGRLDFRLR